MKRSPIQEYVHQTLKAQSIQRGNIPGILGYSNTAKALRRLDKLLEGELKDTDFIERLRASPQFAGPKLEEAIRQTKRNSEINRNEQEMSKELRCRRAFVPHGWIETELNGRREPRGMILMAMRREKMIHIPSELLRGTGKLHLGRVGTYFGELCNDPQSKINSAEIFGDPVRILFRNEFDLCHVYDIKQRKFTGTKSVNWKTDEIKFLYY